MSTEPPVIESIYLDTNNKQITSRWRLWFQLVGKALATVNGWVTLFTDQKEPTGFVDPDNIISTYDPVARTVTLTHSSGKIDYYWNGVKYFLLSPWVSTAHPDPGVISTVVYYFLSSVDGLNFTWSTTVWNFYDITVAVAVNRPSDKFGIRETHGLMQWQSHKELHSQIGTYRVSGGTLTAGTYAENTATDVATTPGFATSVIQDEDLMSSQSEWLQGTYTTMRIGSGGNVLYDTTATFPFRSSGSYILVNNPNTGAETPATNNQYVNVYQLILPVTGDTNSQKYRMVFLQPQAAYTTLTAAQSEDPRTLTVGQFTGGFTEFVFYSRITYILASGDANTGKCRIATGGVSYVTLTKAASVSTIPAITQLTGDVNATGPGSAVATVVGLTGTTSATAGNTGTGTLPTNPQGFIITNINGTPYKIPYYPL